MKYEFSIVMIVKNEENRLPLLLKSMGDFIKDGGEVVLVDTGSTDKTIEIGNEMGCKVVKSEMNFNTVLNKNIIKKLNNKFLELEDRPVLENGQNIFDFGSARNYASEFSSNDLIFQVDGSDIFENFDYNYINEKIIKDNVKRIEYTQIYNGVVELTISRFYNRKNEKWIGRIHEVLTDNLGYNSRTWLGKDKLCVYHYKQDKVRNYMGGLMLDVMEHPSNPRFWHYLGRELFYFKKNRSAIKCLIRHSEFKNAWLPERSQSISHTGECYENIGNPYLFKFIKIKQNVEELEKRIKEIENNTNEYKKITDEIKKLKTEQQEAYDECYKNYKEAIKYYNEAYTIFSGWREPFMRLAIIYQKLDDFQRSISYASGALMIYKTSGFQEPMINYSWLPHSILYWGLYWLNKKEEAKKHFNICMEIDPNNQKFINDSVFFTN